MALLRHYFRLDARSLGLFRIAFASVLISDLLERWRWVDDFYSNEGVLPNHNHLFNLRQEGHSVWSALHAFSTGGEARFALGAMLFFYVCFLIGFRTRVFHALSVVSLVCLSARNLLLENWGNWIAISIAAFTLFLPLGSRFSIDALKKGMSLGYEADARELNIRSKATDADIEAHHAPGWSPLSVGAIAVLVQLSLVYLSMALARTGAWRDGTALGHALHIVRIASPLGFGMRNSGMLTLLTFVVRMSEWAIPAFLFLPILRGPSRVAAAALILAHGLVFGLLFNFGLFGWTLVASSLLVISSETWDRFTTKRDPKRARTIIYDADCGICFWLARLLKRLDTRKLLTLQGNDAVFETRRSEDAEEKAYREPASTKESEGVLWSVNAKTGDIDEKPLPASINAKLLDSTVVVVGPGGEVYTEAAAVSEVLRALPGFGWLGFLISLPVFSSIAHALYRYVAVRRTRISVALGLAACGSTKKSSTHFVDPVAEAIAPSTALRHRITATFRELAVVVLFASMLTQTTHENTLPFKLPANSTLESIAWYSRMIGRWDVLTPEPPTDNSRMVADAITKDDVKLDTLTGTTAYVPFDRPFALGQLWSDYLYRIQDQRYQGYQQAFRTYLTKGGPKWPAPDPTDKIGIGRTLMGVDVYWMTLPPGASESDPAAVTQKRLYRIGRGGVTLSPPPPAMPAPMPPQMPQQMSPMPPIRQPLEPGAIPNLLRSTEDKRE